VETKPLESLKLKELAEILVKHYGLSEGLFDLAFAIQIGVGSFGPSEDAILPGAVVGIGGVQLIKSKKMGPHTVDASVVNPTGKKPSKKATSK
jgi:hypothetical protein